MFVQEEIANRRRTVLEVDLDDVAAVCYPQSLND
jgi:hypothetical protein